jgi:phospholipid/cholesterol/gamma-HCH transport system substrate-binding protein
MSRGRAVISTGLLGALLLLGVAILLAPPGGGGPITVRAEFRDVFPLLTGNYVRVYGGIAGQVSKIELTRRGTVMVTMRLNQGIEPPRSDAIASIRAQDLLGENYLSLSLGTSRHALSGPIPLPQTSTAPRLSDLLNTFRQPERTGLQTLLVEAGVMLENRGVDLNRAILGLRPALGATDAVVNEVGSQNTALRQLIPHVENATSQLSSRTQDLGPLIDSLQATVRATAARSPQLNRGLQALPQTLTQARSTGAELASFATRATPLAQDLLSVAPRLQSTAGELAPFLDHARSAVARLDPTLGLATRFFGASQPTLDRLSGGLQQLTAAGPALSRMTVNYTNPQNSIGPDQYINIPTQSIGHAPLPGAYPVTGQSALRRVTDAFFGPGVNVFYSYNEPDPADPARKLASGLAVFGCSTYGLVNKPGCLADVAGKLSRLFAQVNSGRRSPYPGSALAMAGVTLRSLTKGLGVSSGTAARGGSPTPAIGALRKLIQLAQGGSSGHVPAAGSAPGGPASTVASAPTSNAIPQPTGTGTPGTGPQALKSLLNYLIGR